MRVFHCLLFYIIITFGIQALDYTTIDSHNMHGNIFNFPDQLANAIAIGKSTQLRNNYKNIAQIVCAGMGGSGIAGNMVALFTKSDRTFPITVVKNYELPNWVNHQTLVLLFSYSGNTEETLSCFQHAHEKKSQIIGITSGGKLGKLLHQHNYDMITIPSGLPPRAALGYLTIPMVYALQKIELVPDYTPQLEASITQLKEYRMAFSEPGIHNPAFKIAQALYNTMPIIYGEAGTTATIAMRWRAQLAENSKMIASMHVLPELNHNEIVGWESPSLLHNLQIIWLLDTDMHPRNKLRQEITKNIIGNRAFHLEVASKGSSCIERMLYLIHLGDWVSFWAAILRQVNPTEINNINYLKERMAEY